MKQKKRTKQKPYQTSTKTERLVSLLEEIRKKYPNDKTLVYSQFTSFLDIIQIPLDKAGIEYVRYDGSMNNNDREDTLQEFRSDPTITVMLMSLKAGSLGLNLTEANHVILMDVWWNPFLEDQAIDRVHRLGQKKNVDVTRLTISNTIEDRILHLQDQKRELARGLFEGNFNFGRLTLEDFRFLFRS